MVDAGYSGQRWRWLKQADPSPTGYVETSIAGRAKYNGHVSDVYPSTGQALNFDFPS